MLADDLDWGPVGPEKWETPRTRSRASAIRFFVALALGLGLILFLIAVPLVVERTPARQTLCVNNLRQIGIALQSYMMQNNRLPPAAIRDKAGKPLLSWRVAILPDIEQRAIYDEFHIDEPWDSPHNKTLIHYMPWIYSCPSRIERSEPGTTNYQVFIGPGALFENPDGPRLSEITDGVAHTIAVIEGDRNVPWTKPDELRYDPNRPLPPLGDAHANGFNVLFADGSVRHIDKSAVSEPILRALITRNGGEVEVDDE